MHLETEISVGEAAGAGVAAARRWGTAGWLVLLASICVGIASCVIANLLVWGISRVIGLPTAPSVVLGIVLAFGLLFFVGLPMLRRFMNLRYRRRIAQRGSVGPFLVKYDVAPDAFVYRIGGITKTVQWSVISEMFRAKQWWVLMAQGESYYIPRRVFETADSERAFVTAIFNELGEAARKRSDDASRLIGGQTSAGD